MESPPPPGFSAPSRWPWLAARCELCGTWPAQPAGSPVCAECLGTFTPHAHRCPTCALPLPPSQPHLPSPPPGTVSTAAQTCQQPRLCSACQYAPPPLHQCVAALDYAYPWNQLIHRFKFKGEVAWAQWLAGLMWQAPGTAPLLAATDWWLPIPLSLPRLGERGYNQSWELVKALAPLHAHAGLKQKARADWLLKLAHTSAQHDLNRAARLRNLGTAFALAPHALPHLANAHVLLVDDIMTTGATLHAAAQTLRRGGAASVSALVLARTPAPGEDDSW